MQTIITPEKSTKSESINEYTLNKFVDAVSLTLAKWNAWNVVHLHLIHFCDEQPQVVVRESTLIVTSLECHKGIISPLLYLQPQSEGGERQTLSIQGKLNRPAKYPARLICPLNPDPDGGIDHRFQCNEYLKSRILSESIEVINRLQYT